MHQITTASGIVKKDYCKNILNCATVQFYLRIALQHNSKTYNIFLFTFSDSLSLYALVCFSSHSSLHNGVSLSSHLSLKMGYSGVGRRFGVEVRLGKSDRRGMVAISGYFWVRFLGSWVCSSVVWWFAVAYSWVFGVVCSCEIELQLGLCKFLIYFFFFFFVGHLLDSEFAIGLI